MYETLIYQINSLLYEKSSKLIGFLYFIPSYADDCEMDKNLCYKLEALLQENNYLLKDFIDYDLIRILIRIIKLLSVQIKILDFIFNAKTRKTRNLSIDAYLKFCNKCEILINELN